MKQIVYQNLRMVLAEEEGQYLLLLSIASGFADFEVTIHIAQKDYLVIKDNHQRAAFLQAALHHPFQLKDTFLSRDEQRYYLDQILHAPSDQTESFLTELDHGNANGAISNMVRITCNVDAVSLRNGQWFNEL